MTTSTCTAPACDRKVAARGLCDRHYQQLMRLGHLLDDTKPTYMSTHLARSRSHPVRGLPCVDCGAASKHWSYVGGCPDECFDDKYQLPFCAHDEHYVPRCVRCHRAHDGHPTMGKPGESNHMAKLTETSVLEIRRLHSIGRSHAELGAMFSVSRSLVGAVVRREIWKHVD
jgi:hypothetical protein